MLKKATKTAKGIIGLGMTTGIGSAVIGKIGGSSAGFMQGQLGSSGLAGFTPAITSMEMGKTLMKPFEPKKRRKR